MPAPHRTTTPERYLHRCPAGALEPDLTHALLAVVTLQANQASVTVRDVGRLTDEDSTSQVLRRLRTLRRMGLVTWTDRTPGTIRSPLRVVAHTPRDHDGR